MNGGPKTQATEIDRLRHAVFTASSLSCRKWLPKRSRLGGESGDECEEEVESGRQNLEDASRV